MPTYLWLIPLLPVVGFLVIIFLTRPNPRLSSYVAIGATAAAFVLALLALLAAIALPKFVSMSADARAGVIKGVAGSSATTSTPT